MEISLWYSNMYDNPKSAIDKKVISYFSREEWTCMGPAIVCMLKKK